MHRLGLLLVLVSIGFIDCKHFDVKGNHLKGPGFWSSYKAKVVELPSPTIEHIAPLPVHQRLVLEKTHHAPVQERLVVEEKVHHVEPPQQVIEQVRVVEGVKGVHHQAVRQEVHHQATKSHHQDLVLHPPAPVHQIVQHADVHQAPVKTIVQHAPVQQIVQHTDVHHAPVHHAPVHHVDQHHDLAYERRHEELHQQREQREQLKEIQHFQQIQQHEQIRQQLEQQKHLETVVVQQNNENCEKPAQIVQGKTHEHIEQIIQQKQERNEKLTVEEEAIAEPFPLIPKTQFTCDDKPVLPGLYADLETGCRVYHFCFAKEKKADIVEQVHQDRVDELHHDVHHTNSLLVHHLPQPEQQQMKSFFCGEGTLFNQRLLICDHAVNVICPESIHFYASNLEFGKPSAEPAAQPVQQREITKTNHIVQLVEPPGPIVQVTEKIVQSPPVEIVQHHDAIKIVEPPKPIVQVREQIVQAREPVVQVREEIVQHHEPARIVQAPVKTVVHHPEPVRIVQAPVKTVVHHPEPARIVQEQVKIGHIVEEPPVVVQQRHHEDRFVTTSNEGSFASASNQDWKENRSWSTSRTVWGNTLNGNSSPNNGTTDGSSSDANRAVNEKEAATTNATSSTSSTSASSSSSSTSSSSSSASSSGSSSGSSTTTGDWSSGSSSERLQNRPVNRRFLGELMTSNIPNTRFTCEGKPFQAGLFADQETDCRIYHQCLDGRKSTFLCSRGTKFNQKNLSCDFEERVKCAESEQYYTSNAEFN